MECDKKICTKCNDEKSLDRFEFRPDTNKYRSECKDCKNAKRRIADDKRRREQGCKVLNKYNSEEEKLNAKKECAKIRLENSLKLTSKVCIKCNIEQEIKHFLLRKETGSYRGECNKCKNESLEQWKKENPEKVKEMSKRAYKKAFEKDPEKFREKTKNWRKENLEKSKVQRKLNYDKNPKKHRGYSKKYRDKHPEKAKEDNKKFKQLRPNYQQEYFQNNKEKINERNRKKPHVNAWRKILKRVLKQFGKEKETTTFDLLGYSALQLKQRIECQFTDGMDWNNHGEWHIDHKKRVREFNKNTHVSIVNMLCNLQPLWKTSRTINGVFYKGNLNKG